ncbi:MAG TPA: amino acid permease [Tissierellaceae bacterium]|nr:amino acid permease [Tissierellaceae bacterium]
MAEKRKIGLWDLVLMNVSALYGIRWIARSTASSFGLGLGAILVWVLFSFIYFVPNALICAELASTYPSDGGLYEWVKEAYGKKWGFMVSWLNWTAKLFWYSSFLTFLTVNVAYTFGKPELAINKTFVLIVSLVIFWIVSLVSTKGMNFGKFFTSVGALGSTVPTTLLIVMAFISIFILKREPASTYTLSTMMPKLNMDSLVAISAVMFGLAGSETTANFVTEVDDPQKNFPKAVFISAAIVASLYVLGSLAITMILPPDQITASEGILVALDSVAASLGIGSWFVRVVALGVSLSVFGAILLYIASPIKMLFGSVDEGIFPKRLTRVNKYDIPASTVILQAILVSFILLVTNLLPSVDAIYNVLVTMTALTSLFPYIMLYFAYIKLRKENPNKERPFQLSKNDGTAIGLSRMLLVITSLGIVFSAAPVMDTFKENLIYEIQMIGGALIIIVAGLAIWNNYEKKNKSRIN